MTKIAWPREPDWHLGVTGTRKRFSEMTWYPTDAALNELRVLLIRAEMNGAKYLHHGCCTGWDEAAVKLVNNLPLDLLVYAHPPVDGAHLSQRARAGSHVVYRPKSYRDRNMDIAEQSEILLVGAAWPELDPRSLRSGSWQTARLARRWPSHRLYAVDQQGDLSDVTDRPEAA